MEAFARELDPRTASTWRLCAFPSPAKNLALVREWIRSVHTLTLVHNATLSSDLDKLNAQNCCNQDDPVSPRTAALRSRIFKSSRFLERAYVLLRDLMLQLKERSNEKPYLRDCIDDLIDLALDTIQLI